MPITAATAVIPDNATPEACAEVVDAYAKYLAERTHPDFGQDADRLKKVNGSTDWCETTLAYWLGFLIGPDGSSTGITTDVLTQIAALRDAYEDVYVIPDIEGNALKLAKSLAKQSRASAREAKQRREAQRAPSAASTATLAAPTSPDTTDAMEAAMAAAFGLSVPDYRAMLEAEGIE